MLDRYTSRGNQKEIIAYQRLFLHVALNESSWGCCPVNPFAAVKTAEVLALFLLSSLGWNSYDSLLGTTCFMFLFAQFVLPPHIRPTVLHSKLIMSIGSTPFLSLFVRTLMLNLYGMRNEDLDFELMCQCSELKFSTLHWSAVVRNKLL